MPQSKRKNNLFLWLFLSVGIAVQAITFYIADESVISLVCGVLGICSVVLCSQGNILTFAFGFSQILTYSYICFTEQLYGTLVLNAYYFVTQIYGVYEWRKRTTHLTVTTRKLSYRIASLIAIAIVLVSLLTGWVLSTTNDSQPYLDAFTTVPALVAQVLMILAYREQWYIWFLIDVLYVVIWARAGNWCLFAQHVFWCINCVCGFLTWSKTLQSRA